MERLEAIRLQLAKLRLEETRLQLALYSLLRFKKLRHLQRVGKGVVGLEDGLSVEERGFHMTFGSKALGALPIHGYHYGSASLLATLRQRTQALFKTLLRVEAKQRRRNNANDGDDDEKSDAENAGGRLLTTTIEKAELVAVKELMKLAKEYVELSGQQFYAHIRRIIRNSSSEMCIERSIIFMTIDFFCETTYSRVVSVFVNFDTLLQNAYQRQL